VPGRDLIGARKIEPRGQILALVQRHRVPRDDGERGQDKAIQDAHQAG